MKFCYYYKRDRKVTITVEWILACLSSIYLMLPAFFTDENITRDAILVIIGCLCLIASIVVMLIGEETGYYWKTELANDVCSDGDFPTTQITESEDQS